MSEVTIGTRTFQIRKLPAYPDQLLLSKAAAPVMAEFLPIVIKLIENKDQRDEATKGNLPPDLIIDMMEAARSALIKMTDADLMNLTRRSLTAVQLKQGEAGWANVMTPSGEMMFDLELPVIFDLIFKVAEVNLLSFFFGSHGASPAAPAQV